MTVLLFAMGQHYCISCSLQEARIINDFNMQNRWMVLLLRISPRGAVLVAAVRGTVSSLLMSQATIRAVMPVAMATTRSFALPFKERGLHAIDRWHVEK